MVFFLSIAWLVLAVIVGNAAAARDRSGFGWFTLAFIFSPLIALLLLVAFPSQKAEQDARWQQAADDKALARNIRIGRERSRL